MDLNEFNVLLAGDMSQDMVHIPQSSSTLPGRLCMVDDDESSPSIPETQPAQKKVRRQGNFTVDDDLVLISTWLNSSISTRKGTDQKGKTFWTGITKTFCDNTKTERTDRSVNCRFAKIQKSVNEFSQIVAQLDNSGNSEDSELDKIQEAKSMYRDIHKSAFRFEHCWNVLRNQPKWKETERVAGRRKRIEGLIQSKDSPTPLSPGDDFDKEVDNEGNFTDLEWKETELVAGRKNSKKQLGGLIQSKDSPTALSPGDLDNIVDNEGNFTDLKWKETELVAGRQKRIEGLIQSKDSPTPLSPGDLDNEVDNESNFTDLKWKETGLVAGRKKQTGEPIQSKDSPTPLSQGDLDNEVDNAGSFTDIERPIEKKARTEKERQEKREWENDSPLGSPISDWNVQKLKGQEKRKWEIDCPHDSFISDWKMQKLKMHDDKMKLEQEKMEMAKRNEELKIMTMDTSNLDDDQKEYIMILRANIMNKSRNQL